MHIPKCNTSARVPMASGCTGESYVHKQHIQIDFDVGLRGMG